MNSSELSLENAPDIVSKYAYLKKLLFDKKVGGVLCSKFRLDELFNVLLCNDFVDRLYWKPSVISSHLEQAAKFCKSRESTLNISDSVSRCTSAFSGAFLIT